ncbi:MAG TPA: hypothetical protein VGG02_03675 [Chthoniobacterales bacterium]|jgi:hypothetical protein
MGSNVLPRSAKALIQLALKMAMGIFKVGASVPITMVSKPQMDAATTAYSTAESNFGLARQALKTAYDNFTPAAATLLQFLNTARPIFVSNFGYHWSADWAALGFVNHSTAIPKTIEDRLGVAKSIVGFLEDNPSYEVDKTGVTYANGNDIYTLALEMQGDVLDVEQSLKDAKTARATARAALLQAMHKLVKNLDGGLDPDDPRWLAFGLNMPATPTTPAKPTGLTAQMDVETGGVILTCDDDAADRYRFRGREAGSALPFQLMARATDPTGRTQPIAPGTAMEFMVQAVKGTSQSVPSDSLFYTVPTLAAARLGMPAPSVKTEAMKLTSTAPKAAKSNGNGHGNVPVSNGRRAERRVS